MRCPLLAQRDDERKDCRIRGDDNECPNRIRLPNSIFVVTNTLIARDIRRSVAFYHDVLGATVLREGEPTLLRLGNIWLTINVGGGPTDDKPEVLASPPPTQTF